MEKQPCVYLLTNKRNGTLYVGVTSNLPKRVWEHKTKVVKGFTEKYGNYIGDIPTKREPSCKIFLQKHINSHTMT